MFLVTLTIFQIYCAQIGSPDSYLRYGIIAYQTEPTAPLQTAKFEELATGPLSPHPVCLKIQNHLAQKQPTRLECYLQNVELLDCL